MRAVIWRIASFPAARTNDRRRRGHLRHFPGDADGDRDRCRRPLTGQPYAANATATGIGGASVRAVRLHLLRGIDRQRAGKCDSPVGPGTYTVTAAFSSGNPDYVNASGGPVTFSICLIGPAVSAPSSAALYLNGSLTFSTANGNAITVSDSTASGTSESITLSVTNGTLKFVSITGLKVTSGSNNSASMTVNGTLANLNADLQTLKYTPTSGYNGSIRSASRRSMPAMASQAPRR